MATDKSLNIRQVKAAEEMAAALEEIEASLSQLKADVAELKKMLAGPGSSKFQAVSEGVAQKQRGSK